MAIWNQGVNQYSKDIKQVCNDNDGSGQRPGPSLGEISNTVNDIAKQKQIEQQKNKLGALKYKMEKIESNLEKANVIFNDAFSQNGVSFINNQVAEASELCVTIMDTCEDVIKNL